MKKIVALLTALIMGVTLSSCMSAADRADENLSKAAENFEVPRRITGINGITGEVLFTVEGFCSYEVGEDSAWATCLENRETGEVSRTTLIRSDNVTMVVAQLRGVEVDLFRPRVIFRPETVVPNFDLSTNSAPTEPDPGGN
jgi:hypothetical protein